MKKINTEDLSKDLCIAIYEASSRRLNVVVDVEKVCKHKYIFRIRVWNKADNSRHILHPCKTRRAANDALRGMLEGIREANKLASYDKEKLAMKFTNLERRTYLRKILLGKAVEHNDGGAKARDLYNNLLAKAVRRGHMRSEALAIPDNAEFWVINVQYACMLRNEGLI